MKTVLVSAVALIDRDGRILIAKRPLEKPFGGLWEFPGGKVKSTETPEAALMRELKEELGIDSWESCLAPLTFVSHCYDSFHLLMLVYVCRKWIGQPRNLEHMSLNWVRVSEMKKYPMPPADKPIIATLRDWL